jgi:DNA-binding beta-propeller fold protein YncE
MQIKPFIAAGLLLGTASWVQAAVLPEATDAVKIVLAKKPTTRPMGVAYVPDYKRYYIADGGLGGVDENGGVPTPKSEVHAYSTDGSYLQSGKPGLDSRAIYFNPNSHKLEAITYNISSDAGFTPNAGVFTVVLDDKGALMNDRDLVGNYNPAFGEAGTMPSYDPAGNRYFAKQARSNKVLVVKLESRERVAEINLDFNAAGVQFDDISDHYVAWTGIPSEELALLDVDHKAILVFDQSGKFVGRSTLPAGIKLRAQNHYNGLGYANGMFFVYSETEGEFGTYHGYRISDQAKSE